MRGGPDGESPFGGGPRGGGPRGGGPNPSGTFPLIGVTGFPGPAEMLNADVPGRSTGVVGPRSAILPAGVFGRRLVMLRAGVFGPRSVMLRAGVFGLKSVMPRAGVFGRKSVMLRPSGVVGRKSETLRPPADGLRSVSNGPGVMLFIRCSRFGARSFSLPAAKALGRRIGCESSPRPGRAFCVLGDKLIDPRVSWDGPVESRPEKPWSVWGFRTTSRGNETYRRQKCPLAAHEAALQTEH